MASKDSIGFDFSGFHIPPWVAAEYEIVYLPFPKDADLISHSLAKDYSFLSLPSEAFDGPGKNLICFQEKRLLGNEKIGTRPLPRQVFTQSMLRPEAFAHISLENTSPESLCNLMNSLGLIVTPVFDSQKRFIDSRFHNVISDDLSYEELHPLELVEKDNNKDAALLDLRQAAIDIYGQHYTALGGSDIQEESFETLCGGSLLEAITLSEYARRIACKSEDLEAGGIISYYEVLLTTRALFRAMTVLIDFSIADGSMVRYEQLIKERAEKGNVRGIQTYALELLVSTTALSRRRNAIANVGSYVVRDGFDFLQLCAMGSSGARWGQVIHRSTSASKFHGGIIIKTPKSLEPQRSFYKKNEPRYFQDRYCEGSLSAALAAQFLATLADPAPWKKCDNPECGTYFKHYFTDKGRSNPKATSCSKKCSTRKRNRIANLEKAAIKTACKRYSSVDEAVKYIEERLADEIELNALPEARKRWRGKCDMRF